MWPRSLTLWFSFKFQIYVHSGIFTRFGLHSRANVDSRTYKSWCEPPILESHIPSNGDLIKQRDALQNHLLNREEGILRQQRLNILSSLSRLDGAILQNRCEATNNILSKMSTLSPCLSCSTRATSSSCQRQGILKRWARQMILTTACIKGCSDTLTKSCYIFKDV